MPPPSPYRQPLPASLPPPASQPRPRARPPPPMRPTTRPTPLTRPPRSRPARRSPPRHGQRHHCRKLRVRHAAHPPPAHAPRFTAGGTRPLALSSSAQSMEGECRGLADAVCHGGGRCQRRLRGRRPLQFREAAARAGRHALASASGTLPRTFPCRRGRPRRPRCPVARRQATTRRRWRRLCPQRASPAGPKAALLRGGAPARAPCWPAASSRRARQAQPRRGR